MPEQAPDEPSSIKLSIDMRRTFAAVEEMESKLFSSYAVSAAKSFALPQPTMQKASVNASFYRAFRVVTDSVGKMAVGGARARNKGPKKLSTVRIQLFV
jgi:hypothetical protein